MLLMAERGIEGVNCQQIHRHAKANNNYKNDIASISYLMYVDANNLYG